MKTVTYRKLLQEMYVEVAEKTDIYLKAEKELVDQGNGFVDKEFMNKRNETYREWQETMNDYNGLVSFVRKQNINIDSTLNIPE